MTEPGAIFCFVVVGLACAGVLIATHPRRALIFAIIALFFGLIYSANSFMKLHAQTIRQACQAIAKTQADWQKCDPSYARLYD